MRDRIENPIHIIEKLPFTTGDRGERTFTGYCVDGYPNGRLFICGGLFRNSVVSREYIQGKDDPFYMHMSSRYDLPHQLLFAQIKYHSDGRLYVSGGAMSKDTMRCPDMLASPDILTINPTDRSPTWDTLTPMSHGRFCHAMAIAPNDTIFISGGWYETQDGSDQYAYSSIIQFDMKQDNPTWTHVLDMPESRWAHTLYQHTDGYMYVFGGIGPDKHHVLSTFRFDPYAETPVIDPLPDLPVPSIYPVAITTEDGELYVFLPTRVENQSTVESYTIYRLDTDDTETKTWQRIGSPPEDIPWDIIQWRAAIQTEIPEGSYICLDVPPPTRY